MTFDDDYVLYDDVVFDDLHYALALIYSASDYCGIEPSDIVATPVDLEQQVWMASIIHGEPFIRNITAFKKKFKIRTCVKDDCIGLYESKRDTSEAANRIATRFVEADKKIGIGVILKEELDSGTLFK